MYDVAAVIARIGVGVVFMAHGWQKIEAGVTATGENFDALGVPLPTAAAVYAAFVELLGGAALIAGIALPVTGACCSSTWSARSCSCTPTGACSWWTATARRTATSWSSRSAWRPCCSPRAPEDG
ncbi:hypothetical protein BJF79_16705 [Actinomadura sp. CNU-125]|nr:hypothetical protein BJF79_16705 [Actinomadura sp. CNU-125]